MINGITLIALVVTIVVLLILAGITISLVFSENGIIAKAREAAEKTNQAVINEQKNLGELLNEMDNILENNGSADDEEDLQIAVLERNEDNIKVKMDGKNLTDYQFSLDGSNWSEPQSSSEYTFTDLEKVYIYDSDEKKHGLLTGNHYNIYARARNNKGEIIETNPVQTSNVVEVVGNAECFEYEDLGNEIMITGVKPLYDRDFSKYITGEKDLDDLPERELLIPSYINGKPVTKINYSLWFDMEKKEKIDKGKVIVYDEKKNLIINEMNNDLLNVISIANVGYGHYRIWVFADTSYGKLDFSVYQNTVNETLLMFLVNKYNIVIPPTVNEMVEDIEDTSNIARYGLKQKRYNNNFNMNVASIQFGRFNITIDPNWGESNNNTGIVKILGKNDFKEIKNADMLKICDEEEYLIEKCEFIN